MISRLTFAPGETRGREATAGLFDRMIRTAIGTVAARFPSTLTSTGTSTWLAEATDLTSAALISSFPVVTINFEGGRAGSIDSSSPGGLDVRTASMAAL